MPALPTGMKTQGTIDEAYLISLYGDTRKIVVDTY